MYTWQTTANLNSSADSTINWSTQMSPSSVGPSGRGIMASAAKWRIDTSGATVTTGTSTGYIISSQQQFNSAANMSGNIVAFSPHTTNVAGAPDVTLTVDGFEGPLRTAPNTPLLSGVIIEGSPVVALWNNTDGAFYLQGYYGNPYNIPLGGLLDSTISTPPSSLFVVPNGQAISRVTYAAYFNSPGIGTTFGPGDGSTTFNIINLTGRVRATMEATPTLLTTAGFGGNSSVIGAVNTKGGETETLTAAQIPTITAAGSGSVSVSGTYNEPEIDGATGGSGGLGTLAIITGTVNSTGTASVTTTSNNTSGAAHPNCQPTAIVQTFLRVL